MQKTAVWWTTNLGKQTVPSHRTSKGHAVGHRKV